MSDEPQPLITLLIVDDHEFTRDGLKYSLENKPGFSVLGLAENGRQALEMGVELEPHVILMDISMPVMDGIEATRQIKQRVYDTKVIMLTSREDDTEVLASLAAGADAYCMKTIKTDRLAEVIRMVREGALWVDPMVARLVLNHLNVADTGMPAAEPEGVDEIPSKKRVKYNTQLTDRELSVLKLITDGKSNKEISQALGVTIHTTKAHVANIILKLGVDDRTQAAVKALREQLV